LFVIKRYKHAPRNRQSNTRKITPESKPRFSSSTAIVAPASLSGERE